MTFDVLGASEAPKGAQNVFATCRQCKRGIVAIVQENQIGKLNWAGKKYWVVDLSPKPASTKAPDDVPEAIAKDYKEAADSLRRQKFTSAGMMFRKVLQRATTALATTAEPKITVQGLKLHARIDRLAHHQLITPAMCEWAHLIRLDGNEANHEEDVVFEQSDAEQIQAFTELFLIYAFTLPERVRLARDADADQDA